MTDSEEKSQPTQIVNYDPLAPVSPWNTRQQLALCTAVLSCGNENWNPVSKLLHLFAEPNQETDWCSAKNCAKQYALLLDRAELRRRSDFACGELPWQELIVKRLTVERLEEAQNAIRKDQEEYRKLKEEIVAIENGEMDSRIDILWEKTKKDHDLDHYEKECLEELKGSNEKKVHTDKTHNEEPLISTPKNLNMKRSFPRSRGSISQLPRKSWKQLRLDNTAHLVTDDSATPADKSTADSTDKDVWVINKSRPSDPPQRGRMTRNSLSSATDFGGIPTLKLQRSPTLTVAGGDNEEGEDAPVSPGAVSNTSSTSATTAMTLSSQSSDATVVANEEEKSFSFHIDPEEESQQDIQESASLEVEESSVKSAPAHKPQRTLRSNRSLEDSGSDMPLMFSPKRRRNRSSHPPTSSGLTPSAPPSESQKEESSLSHVAVIKNDVSDNEEETVLSEPEADKPNIEKHEEDSRLWKRAMLVFLENLMTHKHSSVFCNPVRDDEALGYSRAVFRPMDLHKLRRRIETNEINTTAEFVRDLMLIFTNAILYNSSEHLVYQMATTMFADTMDLIEQCLTVRSIDPYVDPRNYEEDYVKYMTTSRCANEN